MKTRVTLGAICLLALLLFMGAAPVLLSQEFSSGSNESYGRLQVSENTTLDLPADGIFHCTTIEVAANSTLTFNRNELNTPVYLLASGNIVIQGTIDVSGSDTVEGVVDGGRGGPGGFDGGKPGFNDAAQGDGYGPGGGSGGPSDWELATYSAGSGSYGSVSNAGATTRKGSTYGSPLLIPLIGGSGGGGVAGSPGRGGGGGGGAILIASSTSIEIGSTGKIQALGGGTLPHHNAGSGGAIRLVAPVVVGTGEVNVSGGSGNYGGAGRIRVDSIDRSQLKLNFVPNSLTSIGATMIVFPPTMPHLDIVEVAGREIPEGSGPVSFVLPVNSPETQTVTVQATDFHRPVDIAVVLTPDSGERSVFEAAIFNNLENPRRTQISIPFPVNVPVSVHAWTR